MGNENESDLPAEPDPDLERPIEEGDIGGLPAAPDYDLARTVDLGDRTEPIWTITTEIDDE